MKAKRKIHILHVVLTLDIGGLESLVMAMCRYIDKKSFSVSVLCLQSYDPLYNDLLEKQGIHVFLVQKQGKLDISFFARIKKILNSEYIDVVHSHSGCFLNAALASFFSKVSGVVYTAHGMPVEHGLKASIENKIAAHCTGKLVAVSEEIKAYLEKSFPFASKKIEVIINGVDTETFRPMGDGQRLKFIKEKYGIPPDRTVIGSVGRLEEIKNYQMLLRAFALVREEFRGAVHLVFIGDGGEKEKLVRLAEDLNLENDVSFLGLQYNLYELVPMIDIFSLSSLSEGTSVSLLETQSASIPAVVTNVGGNSGIIRQGYNGFLCEVNDISAMAEKISLLIADNDLRQRLGNNGRKNVEEKFSLRRMMTQYEEKYRELMARIPY